jgi:hypothetical protein
MMGCAQLDGPQLKRKAVGQTTPYPVQKTSLLMPMMISTCQFADSIPDRGVLEKAIADRIGQDEIDEVELSFAGDLVHILTMDPVFMVYAYRTCIEFGAQPCSHSGAPRTVEWPKWVARPWPDYSWLSKWRIRFSKWKLV